MNAFEIVGLLALVLVFDSSCVGKRTIPPLKDEPAPITCAAGQAAQKDAQGLWHCSGVLVSPVIKAMSPAESAANNWCAVHGERMRPDLRDKECEWAKAK